MKFEKLSKYCKVRNGFAFKSKDFIDDGVPVIRISDIKNDRVVTKNSARVASKQDFSKFIVEKNSILIAMSGATTGKIGMYISDEVAYQNQRVGCFIPDNTKINNEYLFHTLKSFQNSFLDKAQGGAQPNISSKELENMKIPLPPLEDQKKIAHLLSRVESLINQRRESLEKLDALLKSTFLEMFGDPVKNEKGWDKKSSKDFTEKVSVGVVIKPASHYVENGVVALRSLNVKENYFDLSKLVYFSTTDNDSKLKKSKLKEKDVVVVRTGKTGTAAVIEKDLAGANCIDLIIIRPNLNLLNPYFLSSLLNSERGKFLISSKEVGGIQKHFNVGAFKSLKLPLPPVDLQNEFAEIVLKIKELKSKYQSNLSELENLYGSLSQKAFKGELDLSKVKILKPVNDLIEEKEKYSSVRIDLSPLRETFKSFQEFLSSFKTYFDNNSEKINNFIIKLHESTVYFESLSYVIKNKEKLTSSKFDAAYMEGLTSIDSEESIESLIKFILKILGDLEQKYLSNIISGYFESNDKAELSCAEKVEYLEKSIFRNIEQYKLFNALLIQELQPNEKLDVFKIYLTKHLKQKALSFEEINDQMIKDKVKGFFPFRFLKTVLLELDKHDEPWIKQSFGRFVEDHSNETEDSVVFELI